MYHPPFIPVRNESGVKSLSLVERDFIRSCATRTSPSRADDDEISTSSGALRTDGRRWDQLRPQRLHLVRGENTASATIQWSATRVTCTCTGQVLPPAPDRPQEGIVALSVELSPAASTQFRQANPVTAVSSGGSQQQQQHLKGATPDDSQKLLSNRILRCLERILLAGGALDTEALCIAPGSWVWKLSLAVTIQDAAGGNLLDAAVLSCMAALRHYRKPVVEQQQQQQASENARPASLSSGVTIPTVIPSHSKEPSPLPVHHTPLAISFAVWPEQDEVTRAKQTASSSSTASSTNNAIVALMDPSSREELVALGSIITIALNVHGEICLLDYAGGCELPLTRLRTLAKTASRVLTKQLCPLLESSLQQANEQALSEKLRQLQRQQDPNTPLPPKPTREPTYGAPFLEFTGEDAMEVDNMDQNLQKDQAESRQVQTEAEEAYRMQALDYNLGHVATKVREDDERKKQSSQRLSKASSLLLAAMLQSTQSDHADASATSAATADNRSDDPMTEATTPSETVLPESTSSADRPAVALKKNADVDSEEDETMELQNEFASVQKDVQAKDTMVDDDVDDIDDLAAAVKKKKKKSKKKR